MDTNAPNTLPKKERLCGKKGIEKLLARGRHGSVGNIRFIYSTNGQDTHRLLVSVPKKLFKRAVKRNLLKRRIRESWRRLKHGLRTEKHMDVLIIYSTKEVLTYQEINSNIEKIADRLNNVMQKKSTDETRKE